MNESHRICNALIGQSFEHRHQRCDANTAGNKDDRPVAYFCNVERELATRRTNVKYVTLSDSVMKEVRDQTGRGFGGRAQLSLDTDAKMFEAGTIRQAVIARRR